MPMPERRCPDDATTLVPETHHGLTLDVCPACAGIFFDDGEMPTLQGAGVLEAVEDAALPTGLVLIDCETPKRCPGCARLMCAYAYGYSSDIRLDGCDRCGGVWVQDGELARIVAYLSQPPAASGGTPAARRAAEAQNAARHHESLVGRIVGALRR